MLSVEMRRTLTSISDILAYRNDRLLVRFVKVIFVCILPLLMLGCPRPGPLTAGPLTVAQKDFAAPPQGPITVTVMFNKPVDPNSVAAGTSVILASSKTPNAPGSVNVNGSQLVFKTNQIWSEIVGPGGTDTSFQLILRSTVRAIDSGQLQQCKTGNATPGAEPPGDCVLYFVIPG